MKTMHFHWRCCCSSFNGHTASFFPKWILSGARSAIAYVCNFVCVLTKKNMISFIICSQSVSLNARLFPQKWEPQSRFALVCPAWRYIMRIMVGIYDTKNQQKNPVPLESKPSNLFFPIFPCNSRSVVGHWYSFTKIRMNFLFYTHTIVHPYCINTVYTIHTSSLRFPFEKFSYSIQHNAISWSFLPHTAYATGKTTF